MSGEASGLPARGYKWPPFEPGNDAALQHGAYSLRLVPRAEELASLIREQLDDDDAVRFGLLVSTAAALGAKAEAALLALTDPDDPAGAERLNRDARGWAKLWLSALNSLGLTPASARQASADAGLRRLADHVTAVMDAEGVAPDA